MPLDLTDATIVFDLDGTLVDTAPDLAAATNHVFGQIGLAPVAPRDLHPFISRGSRAMIEAGLRLHGVTKSEDEITGCTSCSSPSMPTTWPSLSRPFDGIPELLDTLAQAGARLAVCTNKFEALSKALLRQLDLDRRFAVIAGRDTFDVFKPAPGHLIRTIEMAGGRAGSRRDGGRQRGRYRHRRGGGRAFDRRDLRLYAAPDRASSTPAPSSTTTAISCRRWRRCCRGAEARPVTRYSLPGSSHPQAPEQPDGWIPGTRPGMTNDQPVDWDSKGSKNPGMTMAREPHRNRVDGGTAPAYQAAPP